MSDVSHSTALVTYTDGGHVTICYQDSSFVFRADEVKIEDLRDQKAHIPTVETREAATTLREMLNDNSLSTLKAQAVAHAINVLEGTYER